MKIGDRLHIVGSGQAGFAMTDEYDCHVYLLDGGDEYLLIDAGGGRDTAGILAAIEADGLDPRRVRAVCITHAHADHAAGAAGLRDALGLRVLASPEVARCVRAGDVEASSIALARRSGMYPADFPYPACPVDGELVDGATVQAGDVTVEALETPGHAAGHLSFIWRRNGWTGVFTGDSLFAGGKILLQHTWDCTVQDSIRSVERLAALGVNGFFPGHGIFSLRNGRRHADQAMRTINGRLRPPEQYG